jgi:hypothetical protein
MGNDAPKLTIYAPAPTTHRKCMMLDKIDDTQPDLPFLHPDDTDGGA